MLPAVSPLMGVGGHGNILDSTACKHVEVVDGDWRFKPTTDNLYDMVLGGDPGGVLRRILRCQFSNHPRNQIRVPFVEGVGLLLLLIQYETLIFHRLPLY
jgi:hypothetical protein